MVINDHRRPTYAALVFLPIWMLFTEASSLLTWILSFIMVCILTDIIYSIIQSLHKPT